MSWVKLDDRYFSNGKIRRISIGARLLHVASMCHCAATLNDGEIPLQDVIMVQAACGVLDQSAIQELVREGLWDPIIVDCNGVTNAVSNAVTDVVTGYRVHDFLEYNPPSERVKANREATKARVDKWRKSNCNGVTNAVTNAVSNGPCNTAPLPLPLPLPRSPEESPSARDPSGTSTEYGIRPKHMQASAWFDKFKIAWCKKKSVMSYGKGEADSRACGRLDGLLNSLFPGDVLKAWERIDEVFADFFETNDRAAANAGHQFAFFAANFHAYMIPREKRPSPNPPQRFQQAQPLDLPILRSTAHGNE